MDSEKNVSSETDSGYVPPAIESVTTPEELEREVQYAGITVTHP